MVRIGGIIVAGGIIATITFSFFMYDEYAHKEVKIATTGDPISIGNVNFDIQYVANFESLAKTQKFIQQEKVEIDKGLIEASSEIPDGTWFQIQITAENTSDEDIRMTGGQFYLYDKNDKKYDAKFIGYGENELSLTILEPNKPVTVTTQYDIPYDEEMQYKVGIVPNRFGLEDTTEIAFICIKNC